MIKQSNSIDYCFLSMHLVRFHLYSSGRPSSLPPLSVHLVSIKFIRRLYCHKMRKLHQRIMRLTGLGNFDNLLKVKDSPGKFIIMHFLSLPRTQHKYTHSYTLYLPFYLSIYISIYVNIYICMCNQKIILADKANFSFDFGLIFAMLSRFLPLCIVLAP